MADDEKTRVIPRKAAKAPGASASTADADTDHRIVFHCPAGHRLVVPVALAGKRGTCSKCGVALTIPQPGPAASSRPEAVAPPPPPIEPTVPVADPPAVEAAPSPPASGDLGWNFIEEGPASEAVAPFEAVSWASPSDIDLSANPMAALLARLWYERDHGGVVEIHLTGGAVLLPEEFSPRWSGGTHGLFASQAADGSVTLTAVAWDTVQRIVVRQLTAVPDDLFD